MLGFLLVPILSALAPLLVIPAITGAFGGETWAAVAVGQSVGSAAAVVVELGWGLNGPQRVARASAHGRGRIYAVSMATKLLVLVAMTTPVLILMAAIAPIEIVNSQIIAMGYLITGLSPVWFFIGEGRPLRILLWDAIPRLLSALVGAVLIVGFHAGLDAYAISLVVGGLIPPIIGFLVSRARVGYVRRVGLRRLVRLIRFQASALGGRAASALYISLPITLVGIAAPGALVLFSAVERMMRLGLSLLASIPNALQAWVGSPQARTRTERRRRVRLVIFANALLGLVSAAAFTALAPFAASVLFSGTVEVSPQLAALPGVVIFITCVSRATGGLGLVAYRRISWIAVSALVGACVGLPAVLLLANLFGTPGAFVGEILAESCVLVIQVIALARAGLFRRPATDG